MIDIEKVKRELKEGAGFSAGFILDVIEQLEEQLEEAQKVPRQEISRDVKEQLEEAQKVPRQEMMRNILSRDVKDIHAFAMERSREMRGVPPDPGPVRASPYEKNATYLFTVGGNLWECVGHSKDWIEFEDRSGHSAIAEKVEGQWVVTDGRNMLKTEGYDPEQLDRFFNTYGGPK